MIATLTGPGLTLGARLRQRGLVISMAISAAVSLLLTGRSFMVPLLPNEIAMTANIFVALTPIILVTPQLASRTAPFEALAVGSRLLITRVVLTIAVWVASSAAAGVGSVVALARHDPDAAEVLLSVLRNVGLLLGLALMSGAFCGAELAWLAPSALAVATVFWGRDVYGDARRWATLIAPAGDRLSGLLSSIVFLAGVSILLAFDFASLIRRPRRR